VAREDWAAVDLPLPQAMAQGGNVRVTPFDYASSRNVGQPRPTSLQMKFGAGNTHHHSHVVVDCP